MLVILNVREINYEPHFICLVHELSECEREREKIEILFIEIIVIKNG